MHEVHVIGGGIGGLAVAIALGQRGIRAQVHEATPELRPVGAGIVMPPNALTVLHRLGLADRVRNAGRELQRAEIHDASAGRLQAMDVRDAERRYGYGMIGIHRARLHSILADALPSTDLLLDRTCVGIEVRSDRAVAEFRDGSRVEATILIGADGLRSAVRHSLFPGVAPRYSGQTSFRGIVRRHDGELDAGTVREIWGPGNRFGYVPIGEGEVYWFATYDASAGEGDGPQGMPSRLAERFAAYPAPVPELIAGTALDAITRTDMYDLPSLPRWYSGRAVLLGDAAHATTPNLGQGGAQAIEDAFVLANRLATDLDPIAAFEAFQRARQPKTDLIVSRSFQLGRIAHLSNPVGRRLRNLILRATPESVARRQTEVLFRVDY
jgi:2-polyprenyl-6-methoxyphenol hydroxylase-like FAD-dependent oxidoreductase